MKGLSKNRTFPMKMPVGIMMEHRHSVQVGKLLEIGPSHARVRTVGRLRRGEPVVITVSVPESTAEKTQALFRLESSVSQWTRGDDAEGAYLLGFETRGMNLESAKELFGHFRTRGLLDPQTDH